MTSLLLVVSFKDEVFIMKLEQLHYLREAVKYNSISIAAEKSYISQPAFSGAISKLEKELGITLLRRNSKGVTPTEVGKVILEKAVTIFTAVEEIRESANLYGQMGVINIAAIPCISDRILPVAMQKLKDQHVPFSLSMTTAESHTILHNVASGTSALGILFYHPAIEQTMVTFTHLFDDQYVLYVGSKSPLWSRDAVTLAEALAQPYIAYREEFLNDYAGWTAALSKEQIPHIAFRTDELESIRRMISQDNYVAFFPKFMSQDDIYLKMGFVKALPISDSPLKVDVGYIENTKYRTSSMDKIFLKSLKEAVEEAYCQQEGSPQI